MRIIPVSEIKFICYVCLHFHQAQTLQPHHHRDLFNYRRGFQNIFVDVLNVLRESPPHLSKYHWRKPQNGSRSLLWLPSLHFFSLTILSSAFPSIHSVTSTHACSELSFYFQRKPSTSAQLTAPSRIFKLKSFANPLIRSDVVLNDYTTILPITLKLSPWTIKSLYDK
jgi:hypothetical protein